MRQDGNYIELETLIKRVKKGDYDENLRSLERSIGFDLSYREYLQIPFDRSKKKAAFLLWHYRCINHFQVLPNQGIYDRDLRLLTVVSLLYDYRNQTKEQSSLKETFTKLLSLHFH